MRTMIKLHFTLFSNISIFAHSVHPTLPSLSVCYILCACMRRLDVFGSIQHLVYRTVRYSLDVCLIEIT